jgi:UDP-glucose 4-epimerase
VEIVREVVGQDLEVIHQPARPYDVPRVVLDVGRAREKLGWEKITPLLDGVRKQWQWLQQTELPGC